jgi:butyryl-CoA dehydrogenase
MNYFKLLELLTPVAKTYPCESGVQACSNAVQVFGGYGFTEDFPVEQYYRDVRITPIYEGTTGIQSLDLLGRKVLMENGEALKLMYAEITDTISLGKEVGSLENYCIELKNHLTGLQSVTSHLTSVAQGGDVELFLSDANLYMEQFSLVVIAWQWLKMGIAAKQKMLVTSGDDLETMAFLESKIQTMKYFFHYELPKTNALSKRLLDSEVITILKEKDLAFA